MKEVYILLFYVAIILASAFGANYFSSADDAMVNVLVSVIIGASVSLLLWNKYGRHMTN